MNYQTFEPQPDLKPLVSCYWTLEVPRSDNPQKQRIIPDGTIEMAFILGDDIKRYISKDNFIIQPRAMVLGQTMKPFYIEPTGHVNTFAIRFFPYGFANFVSVPLKLLANKETPINELFEETTAIKLHEKMVQAINTEQRIEIIESFLFSLQTEKPTIDSIVRDTIDTLLASQGNTSINKILREDLSKRRSLERKFVRQIGVSPKQLGKLIRLQTALKMLLNKENQDMVSIAYDSGYYDQSHFIKDFREFTGVSPKEFLGNENVSLSYLFYK